MSGPSGEKPLAGEGAEHARGGDDCRAELAASRVPDGCALAEALLAAHAAGAIAPESEQVLRSHVEHCRSCSLVAGSLEAPAMAQAFASAADRERNFDELAMISPDTSDGRDRDDAAELAVAGAHDVAHAAAPDLEAASVQDLTCRTGRHVRIVIAGHPPRRQLGENLAVIWEAPNEFEEYRIIRRLGAGTMGIVFLAHDTLLDRPVAIKFISALEVSAGTRERFLTEARAVARLSHPNVVAVHRVGEVRQRPYLVSEYVQGTSLAAMTKPIPWPRALKIAMGLARGLGAAHRCGVLHRDIKPANVMLGDDDEPKLLDFGLAKVLRSSARHWLAAERAQGASTPGATAAYHHALDATVLQAASVGEPPHHHRHDGRPPTTESDVNTGEGAIVGTPLYLAPELWGGASASAASDVYALGVVLRELLTGQAPLAGLTLPGLTLLALAARAQTQDLAPIASHVADLPVWLATLIDACTSRDVSVRPVSGDALCERLEAGIAQATVDPRRSPTARTSDPPTEHRAMSFDIPDGRADVGRARPGMLDERELALRGGEGALIASAARARVGQPIDYRIERHRHDGFVGRAALLARLDQLLVADAIDRWVVVIGGPGMGKSAVLATWLLQREATGAVVPHHFIRRGEYDWDDPAKLVGSLVAQLDDQFGDQREPAANAQHHPAARLAKTLTRLSASVLVPRRERLVVLIDGLDEYDPPLGSPIGDPLAAFLPHALPAGVSFLCASRPRHPYLSVLEARDGELVRIDLDAPDAAADNDATVRCFWERATSALGVDASFVDEAVARAGGNLQHAVTLRKHVAGLSAAQRRVEAVPRGLAALLGKLWDRISTHPIAVHGLGILCAAREALTLDELGVVAGWADAAQRQAFVRGASELLVETRRGDGQTEYRLHHDAIRAHIASTLGAAVLRGHHAALARQLATWPAPADTATRRYALRHALIHRIEAGDWAEAWRLAADMGFLEAKCRELGAHEVEADVARAAERCRTSGHEAIGLRFDDLARVLVRESHWLRDAPAATAALVWNRLRQLGWSEEDLEDQLRIPVEAMFLRVRHGATRESPALVRDLVGHTEWVTACAVTPDGRRVVSASHDRTLKVWDLDSGRALATFEGHASWVSSCTVTPDGRRVVSGSGDRTLKVWDLDSGRVIVTLEGHSELVNACAVTPDGLHVISGSGDRTLKVWDLDSGSTLATLEGHTDWLTACAVTPDGRRVVSASRDLTLKVWDLGSGRVLATFEGHADVVTACAVTPDGRRVVSASRDQTLKVWDLDSGRVLATFEGHADRVTACAVTRDGRHVVSASGDQTLKVWDLDSGRVLATFEGHADRVTACAVTRDGRRMVSASGDQTLKVWDLDHCRLFATFEGHAAGVNGCAVTRDGRRAVSASRDLTLRVWDLDSGRALATLEGHSDWVNACAVTPDGRRVVSASGDQTLKVWDLDSGRLLATLHGHADWVRACAVTPDGRHVVSASADRTLKVWDLESGQVLTTLEGHAEWVKACAVTPDGRHVVSASRDRMLKVWDLDSGNLLATLEGHTGRVTSCAVTPDGRRVVSGSRDRTLKVWDLSSGRVLATLAGHAYWVNACAVTPDGRHAISASADQTLKVWDLDSYACVLTHRGDVFYMAVAATATAVIAGDFAGTVWCLDWPPRWHR